MIDHIIRSDPAVNLSTSYGEALPWTNGSVQAMTTLKQARPGIRFQYTGGCPQRTWRVGCILVGSRLMAGPGSPGTGSDSSARGRRRGRTWRVICIWITSDGGAKQPRYMIRFQYMGRVSAAHGARRVHPSRIMYDGGPGMQSHHTHRNFLFGMVHLPPS
ncbi:hypothetical protein B0H17DRAFT_1146190 [Mycena rosella]|uniref:Uncharacterized protein n=1 Tax=Mycena rosella TaxID=1033263 RepID=A0AAD7G120_MYCRO|nr:hypothetical protein B0H17DRAFT_1146190 [Mycena rosella]